MTELKQEEVSNAVTKWNATIIKPSTIPLIMRKAFRIAVGGRPGAVHISIPEDIHESTFDFETESSKVPKMKRFLNGPDKKDVEKVASLFKKSKSPVILAGGGVHLFRAYK